MKTLLPLLFWMGTFVFVQAKTPSPKPNNLYEQLCEVNPHWIQNRSIAQQLGFLKDNGSNKK